MNLLCLVLARILDAPSLYPVLYRIVLAFLDLVVHEPFLDLRELAAAVVAAAAAVDLLVRDSFASLIDFLVVYLASGAVAPCVVCWTSALSIGPDS